jgi:hypothetical protein
MKNGILYFLKFDRITYAARAVLVLIILSVPKLPKQGDALPLAIVIGAVAVFFSLFHVRSNKYVRNLIKLSEEEFVKDFRRHYELSDNCNIHVTRSFAADDNARLSHRLDGEMIYPHLIFMTYYTMMDRLVLHIRVKSLLKENVEEDFFYEVPKGSFLDLKIEKIDAKIEQVLVKFPDTNGKSIPEFPMRLDFHLRDLLKACSCDKYDL